MEKLWKTVENDWRIEMIWQGREGMKKDGKGNKRRCGKFPCEKRWKKGANWIEKRFVFLFFHNRHRKTFPMRQTCVSRQYFLFFQQPDFPFPPVFSTTFPQVLKKVWKIARKFFDPTFFQKSWWSLRRSLKVFLRAPREQKTLFGSRLWREMKVVGFHPTPGQTF